MSPHQNTIEATTSFALLNVDSSMLNDDKDELVNGILNDVDLDEEMSLLDSTYDVLLKSPDGSTKSNSPAVPARKVSLKRNISDVISSLESSKPKATSSDDSQHDNKKKIIKLSEFTSHNQQSRIEMRIKKFGAIKTNRKEARAVRFGITAIESTPKNNNISSVASVVALEKLKKRAEHHVIRGATNVDG